MHLFRHHSSEYKIIAKSKYFNRKWYLSKHQDVKKAFNRLLARQMENSASLAFMLAEYDAMTGNRIEL